MSTKLDIRNTQVSSFFFNKIKNFGFLCCSTREDLSIHVLITTIDETRVIFFSQCTERKRLTDMIVESSYGDMSAHKKFKLKAQNYEFAVDRNMHLRMTGMHN